MSSRRLGRTRAIAVVGCLGLGMTWGCSSPEPQAPSIENYLPSARALGTTPAPKKTGAEGEGATPTEAKALTLSECVKIGLAENPLNEAAKQGVAVAREGVGEAQAPYYPQATFNADYRRWKTHAFLPSGLLALAPPGVAIPTEVGPVNDYGINVAGSYIVFDSGERRAKLITAKANLNAASEEAASVRQDIALNVEVAYFTHTAALSAREVAQANLDRANDHLRLAEKRKEIGVAVEADVMRARVSASDANLTLVEAKNLVRVSRGNLNTAMGLPVELAADISQEQGAIESPEKIDVNEALRRAVYSRSELKAAVQRIAGAKSGVDLAKSAFGPKVVATGQYGRRDEVFFPEDDDWSIGAAVEWPIFTGFMRVHQLAQAKASLSKEEAQVRQEVLQVRQEVWRSHSDLTKAYEAVKAAEVLVADADTSMKLTKQRYDEGMNTITDLLDAQTALARAQGSQVRAEWDYFLSKARFDRSTGALATTAGR